MRCSLLYIEEEAVKHIEKLFAASWMLKCLFLCSHAPESSSHWSTNVSSALCGVSWVLSWIYNMPYHRKSSLSCYYIYPRILYYTCCYVRIIWFSSLLRVLQFIFCVAQCVVKIFLPNQNISILLKYERFEPVNLVCWSYKFAVMQLVNIFCTV